MGYVLFREMGVEVEGCIWKENRRWGYFKVCGVLNLLFISCVILRYII